MIDRDQMHAWLAHGQDYPGGADSADRAVRMVERAKASMARIAPDTMFDTEPAQIFSAMEGQRDD